MGLRDFGATLPPGFRFYPTDEELVCHYLEKKVTNTQQDSEGTLVDIDLHICEPWQLPEVAKLNSSEWYFFSFRKRKYATGFRTNRATTSGYWKATGKDKVVLDPKTRALLGMRKTLVFYKNRAPNGVKTGWIMHEFRLETHNMPPKDDWVLCRVFNKSRSITSTEMFNSPPSGSSYHETGTSGVQKTLQENDSLQVSQEQNRPSSSNILANLQSEDEFGFLDLAFHESNVEDILHSSIETNEFDQFDDSMFRMSKID